MSRAVRSFVWSLGLAATIAGNVAGCAHLIETRAITAFANSLEAKDLDALKDATSDDFKNRTLRTATAMEDLKILRLPDGKTTVVKVEPNEDDKNKKKVTVQVGEDKKEIFYELSRDEAGRWVVDDIYLRQKKKGLVAYKSVSEQMDLLLTVREFLDAWHHGTRDQVLDVTTPKLHACLEELPPSVLAQFTRQVTQGKSPTDKFKPTASLDEKVAVVKLPRMSGENIVTLALKKGKWQVSDVAIASKDEEEKLPSLLNLAHAVNRCVSFLSAYQDEDKRTLGNLCTREFFDGSLSFADLKQVKLPDPQLPEHELQVKLRGNRADFTLRNDSEFVVVDMQRQPETATDALPTFVVSDVTIYEIASKQEKRLSAMFTAQGILEVFIDALARRKINEVKHCSTQNFTSRVWSKMNEAIVSTMPLESFDATQVEYVSASFQGALTKIDVRQGGQMMTYLMRDEGGRFKVDDIEWQVSGVPKSVKLALEVMIPIQDFASGVSLGRDANQQSEAMELIQSNCSNEFNRAVWMQTKFVPSSGMSADTFLMQAPLTSMAIGENKQIEVRFGDNLYGAKVTMRQEHERYVVDDVVLVAGAEESQRMSMRSTLRTMLAKGEARAPQSIVPVHNVAPSDRRVQQANLEVPEDVIDPRYAPTNPPRELEPDEPDPFGDEPEPAKSF